MIKNKQSNHIILQRFLLAYLKLNLKKKDQNTSTKVFENTLDIYKTFTNNIDENNFLKLKNRKIHLIKSIKNKFLIKTLKNKFKQHLLESKLKSKKNLLNNAKQKNKVKEILESLSFSEIENDKDKYIKFHKSLKLVNWWQKNKKIRRFFKKTGYKRKALYKKNQNLRLQKRFSNTNLEKFKSVLKFKDYFHYKLTIVVKSNNVFCTLTSLKDNKMIANCNAGKYKIKISKKTIRYTYNEIITRFLKQVKKIFFEKKSKSKKKLSKKQQKIENQKKKKAKWLKENKESNELPYEIKPRFKSGLIVNITAPARQRRKIIKNIKYNYKQLNMLFKILDKKIFNGCRAPKKIRKKRRRIRALKA